VSDLPQQDRETYLGDGVYARFDGWQVWLRAPREGGDHVIALEPEVYRALQSWLAYFPTLERHMTGREPRTQGDAP